VDPDEIFHALVEEGVEYVLIGGLAATVHGVSLVTQDTDICFRQSLENCERLARAVVRLGAEIFPARQVPIPITPDLLHTHRLVHLRTRAGRLDLIASVPGLGTYDDLIEGTMRIELGAVTIAVLSVNQLIQAKAALNQPKDREHLDQLLAIRDLRRDQGGTDG
jgi:predicted nucleotidyltransferase